MLREKASTVQRSHGTEKLKRAGSVSCLFVDTFQIFVFPTFESALPVPFILPEKQGG